jgi:pyruvate dehydrogenase (quinone)
VAAKFAYPDRVVFAISGDGSMQMLGNDAMVTVAKYWKRWEDPRLIILVQRNKDLNMVTWEQRVLTGEPKFQGSQDIPAFDYAAYGRSLGLDGIAVTRPEQVAGAWDMALNARRPFVLDAVCDPDVPPLPPHIFPAFARNFAASVLEGDPDSKGMIVQSLRQMLAV